MALMWLLRYPATWAAAGIVAIAHIATAQWFPLRPLASLLLVGVDVALLVVWALLAVRSPHFQRFGARQPHLAAARELRGVLAECSAAFRVPATDCLSLISQVAQEFDESADTFQLDDLMLNLLVVAKKNRELERRRLSFGTKEQQQQMQSHVDREVVAVAGALRSLQDLSGNLTLLEADVSRSAFSLQDLEHANAAMREVIQEATDEPES
jgi:hypothetical protein